MENLDRLMILTLSFPFIFAITTILFVILVLPNSPVLAGIILPFSAIIELLSLVALPFMMIGDQDPVILFSGIISIILLSGSIHYLYAEYLVRNQKRRVVLLIAVTFLQTGLFCAMTVLLSQILFLLRI